jgi:hypothetical protein
MVNDDALPEAAKDFIPQEAGAVFGGRDSCNTA